MKLHVIVTVYNRIIPIRRFIYDFLCQTSPSWMIHVVQDGNKIKDTERFIRDLNDPRITFTATEKISGAFGFPNRDMMLKKIQAEDTDFILHTNDDNQYMPVFVDMFLRNCIPECGFIYCDTIHSYMNYEVLFTELKVSYIDMGSFIVRADIAKAVGFRDRTMVADGIYAEDCAAECARRSLKIFMIRKPLFVHN